MSKKKVERFLASKSYSEPSNLEMSLYTEEIGYKGKYPASFLRDLIKYNSNTFFAEDLSKCKLKIPPQLDRDDFETEEDYQKEIQYHENIQQYIESIELKRFNGNTPMQKAFSVWMHLENAMKQKGESPFQKSSKQPNNKQEENNEEREGKEKGKNKSKNENGNSEEGQGEGEAKGKNQTEDNDPNGDKISAFWPGAGDGNEEYKKRTNEYVKLTNQELNMNIIGSKSIIKQEVNPNAKIPEIAALEMDRDQRNMLEKISILESRGKIKSRRDPFDKDVNMMNEYSEIGQPLSWASLAMPTFKYRFATKSILVQTFVPPTKQLLALAIDNSGSMGYTNKVNWVKAIITNRLDAVCKGNAELYICWYAEGVIEHTAIKITNKKEALDFLNKGYFGNFDMGGTNIQGTAEQCFEEIKNGKWFGHKIGTKTRPELVMINDGNDYVNPAFEPKYMLHAFILENNNKTLKKIIEKSNGHYEEFHG